MFQNNTVDIHQIPTYQNIVLNNLHENYKKVLKVNAVGYIFISIAISIAVYFIFQETQKFIFIGVIMLLFSYIAIAPILALKNKKYAFREYDVIFTKGLFTKSTHIVPYIRLQHVVIKQGWYAKKLGLASLKLYTAANDNVDVTIPGLTLQDAERWKTFLLNRLQELEDDSNE